MPYCESSSPPALVLTFSCPIPTQQLFAAQVLPPDSFVSIAAIEQDLSAEFRFGDACKAFSICCGLGVWQAQATPQATSTMKRYGRAPIERQGFIESLPLENECCSRNRLPAYRQRSKKCEASELFRRKSRTYCFGKSTSGQRRW